VPVVDRIDDQHALLQARPQGGGGVSYGNAEGAALLFDQREQRRPEQQRSFRV
jgi:hypothetical protein